MTTLISIYPYDPGSDSKKNLHGCKSYLFWPSMNDEFLGEKDKAIFVQNGQGALEWPPRSLSSVYVLVQIILRYFLGCLKRVAVTVKIYPLAPIKEAAPLSVDLSAPRQDDQIPLEKKRLRAKPNLTELKVDRKGLKETIFDFGRYFNEHPIEKPCLSTTFSTTIFEVKNGGLQHLIKDIAAEIKNYQSSNSMADTDHGSIIACCDLVWSAPSKFRSYWTELYVENEVQELMRSNNQRIYDLLFGRTCGLRRASKGGTTQRAGSTNTDTDTHVQVYRHFYPELMNLADKQAAKEHGSMWSFDSKLSKVNMDWSVIGDFSATTVVAMNLVILKF